MLRQKEGESAVTPLKPTPAVGEVEKQAAHPMTSYIRPNIYTYKNQFRLETRIKKEN